MSQPDYGYENRCMLGLVQAAPTKNVCRCAASESGMSVIAILFILAIGVALGVGLTVAMDGPAPGLAKNGLSVPLPNGSQVELTNRVRCHADTPPTRDVAWLGVCRALSSDDVMVVITADSPLW